ncbi:uroporphyrin-III C/tetrapyrrole methyltransferase [Anopheles sinensis]|uniref:Uroporphyrin-III C/tetrapyrrole methyltransferase n=1 Tax=Anopheles sinensis TaxID=74873 RepID=A0A084W3W8_ANOSI|nr:uroporphyrin-III C/tetrapyrrole methyltransferase [Anopheles sinensis]
MTLLLDERFLLAISTRFRKTEKQFVPSIDAPYPRAKKYYKCPSRSDAIKITNGLGRIIIKPSLFPRHKLETNRHRPNAATWSSFGLSKHRGTSNPKEKQADGQSNGLVEIDFEAVFMIIVNGRLARETAAFYALHIMHDRAITHCGVEVELIGSDAFGFVYSTPLLHFPPFSLSRNARENETNPSGCVRLHRRTLSFMQPVEKLSFMSIVDNNGRFECVSITAGVRLTFIWDKILNGVDNRSLLQGKGSECGKEN